MFQWRKEPPPEEVDSTTLEPPHVVVASPSASVTPLESSSSLPESTTLLPAVIACADEQESTCLPDFVSYTESSTVPQSWKESLYHACIAKQCLTRTPHQVLQQEQTQILLLPSLDSVIISQAADDFVATSKAIVQEMQKNNTVKQETTTTTWSTRRIVSGVVSWTVAKIYDTVLRDDDDDYYQQEEVTWNEPDDHVNSQQQHPIKLVEWDEPVVCVPLVQECVEDLVPRTTDTLLALHRYGTGDFSFAKWMARPYHTHDLNLVAHVLVEAGHAVFVKDYIVFGNNTTDNQRQVAVALVQLQQALLDTERQLLEWTERADDCTIRASHWKKQNNVKGALHELQKRKLLETKMDHARACLLNLQQAHDTLETAHLQHSQVLQPLMATASALKALRQEYSVEDVDELYDDLKDEYQHLNDTNVENDFENNSAFNDEDELLEELERLAGVNDNDDDDVEKEDKLLQELKIPTAKDDNAEKETLLLDNNTGTLTIETEKQMEPLSVESAGKQQDDEEKQVATLVAL
jgi:hypothetical protein